jgi:hypothetical protein
MAQIGFAATQENSAAAQLWPRSRLLSPPSWKVSPKATLGLCLSEFELEMVSAVQRANKLDCGWSGMISRCLQRPRSRRVLVGDIEIGALVEQLAVLEYGSRVVRFHMYSLVVKGPSQVNGPCNVHRLYSSQGVYYKPMINCFQSCTHRILL